MIKNELEQIIKNIGIELIDIGIVYGNKIVVPCVFGIYQENDEWVIYSINERGKYSERYRGSESQAYENILRKILVRLFDFGYINGAISENIILTSQDTIVDFLKSKYNMNDYQANQTWEYLKQDFHVLNEVKYYVINGEFVPEKYCYKVKGYSAQQLFESTYLDVIGAFNYLVFLKRKPQEALAALKAGLPRK